MQNMLLLLFLISLQLLNYKWLHIYIAEINKKMQKPSFINLVILLLLVFSSRCYNLEGSWELVADGPKYQSLQKLTFQFMKDVDSEGQINTKLFIYDCFIAQFNYEVTENQIALNFKTSSMLSEDCSLAAVNQLRNLVKKVFFFGIIYDKLVLYSLNEEPIFQTQRLKIDYSKILVGAWQLNSYTQPANNPARINASNINLCGDRGQLRYSVTTINGTYPQLKTQVILNQGCSDTLFLSFFSKCSFFQISQNRTHIIFYDYSLRYLFNGDKIGRINSDSALSSSSSQLTTQAKQNPPLIQTPPQSQVINNIPQQIQPSNQPQAGFSNQQESIKIQQTQIQPQQSVVQQIQAQTNPTQQIKNRLQEQAQIKLNQNLSQQQSQPTNLPIMSPKDQNQLSNIDNIGSSIPKSDINTFSFDLTKNNQFSDFFSSTPIFGSIKQNKIDSTSPPNYQTNPYQAQPYIQQPINLTPSTSYSYSPSLSQKTTPTTVLSQSSFNFDLTSTNDNFNYDPSISDSFFTQYGLTKSSLQSGVASSGPFALPQEIQKIDQIQPKREDLAAFSNPKYGSLSVSQIIKNVMNSTANSIPISQFLISNKWLLKWLNGFNALPNDLSRVYMIFTSSKIILYCPCNTYYTNYKLQGNDFKGISWYGTNKQCLYNRDYLVTNYVFYSSSVRPNGDSLYLWYKSQAKMVMFEPYY